MTHSPTHSRRVPDTTCLPFAAIITLLVLLLPLAGCSSDSNDDPDPMDNDGNEQPIDITVEPGDIDAVASLAPVGTRADLDLTAVTQATGLDASVGLQSLAMTDATAHLVFRQFHTNADNQTAIRYSRYDMDSGEVAVLGDASTSSTVSRDGSAMAWLESGTCNLWYQSLTPAADPVRINDLLLELSCPRVPSLSDDGRILWVSQAVGSYDANGTLRFDGFDTDQYGTVIVNPAMQRVVDLSTSMTPLGDAELDSLTRSLQHGTSVSHDGQTLLFKAYFLPAPVTDNGVHDYVIGSLLVDATSGEYTLLNRNRYSRFYSDRVPPSGDDGSAISGDGTVAWYIEADGTSVNEGAGTDVADTPTRLIRHDLSTDQVATIEITGTKTGLLSSDDGNTLVFQLDGEVVVYRHETQDILHTATALKFCTDPADETSCEFDDSSYYVRNDPAMISDDGSTVLISILSQRPDIDTPQNTQELMLLDVNSGVLQRAAPDQDTSFFAMTPSADRVVFLTEWSEGGEYLGDDRVVVIRRE